MENRTNKIIAAILTILILAIIGGIISTVYLVLKVDTISKELNNLKTEFRLSQQPVEETSGYDTSAFKEIKGTDVKKESKGDTIVVLVARQSCGYCALYAPIITKVSQDYEFTVRYVDLEKIIDIYSPNWDVIDQESYDTMVGLPTTGDYKDFMDEFGATPMTVVIKDGKIIGGVVGYVSEETLIQTLKDSGFLK